MDKQILYKELDTHCEASENITPFKFIPYEDANGELMMASTVHTNIKEWLDENVEWWHYSSCEYNAGNWELCGTVICFNTVDDMILFKLSIEVDA